MIFDFKVYLGGCIEKNIQKFHEISRDGGIEKSLKNF
jgi:hypothetical protein